MGNKVSHICIIDEEKNIYLESNQRLDGLTFIGGKLKDGESYEEGALRELKEETNNFLSFSKGILDEIDTNIEQIDGIIWEGKLYGLKISTNVGELLTSDQKNIKKINFSNIDNVSFSKKLNKENLISRIKLTIKKYLENE